MINDFRFGGPPVFYHLFFEGNDEREEGKDGTPLSDSPSFASDVTHEANRHGIVDRFVSRIATRFPGIFTQEADVSVGATLKVFAYRYTVYFILFVIVPR